MGSPLEIKNIRIVESKIVYLEESNSDWDFNFNVELFYGEDTKKAGKIEIICEGKEFSGDESNYLKIKIQSEFFVSSESEEEFGHFVLNAVSITFPYLRSHITTLTSSVGMNPVIIPPLNVHELLSE